VAVESATTPRDLSSSLTETLENQEKKIIEAALAESDGKVAGPTGQLPGLAFRAQRWTERFCG
jgi:hypothetical protein